MVFQADASAFVVMPGSPIAYWAREALIQSFVANASLKEIASPVEGIKTGDNDLHLRFWFEVSRKREHLNMSDSDNCLWRKMCKGGEYRKWYGNNEYVCRWGKDGEALLAYAGSSISNRDLIFTPAFNWTYISSGRFAAREAEIDSLYNNKGPACYCGQSLNRTLLAALNSSYSQIVLDITSPTLDYKPGGVGSTPVPNAPIQHVDELADLCIKASKADWDSAEPSWDFLKHPLV